MDKQNSINNYTHTINLVQRKNLLITGVKKIENFDEEQFFMETVQGFLTIKGEGLELIKLDTTQGNVTIKGIIHNMLYLEESSKGEKQEGIFNRLFK
jgi:sporulation protein YabP